MSKFRIVGVFVAPHTHDDSHNKPPTQGLYEKDTLAVKALQNTLIADGINISQIELDLLGRETTQSTKEAAYDELWPLVAARFVSMHLRSVDPVYKISQTGSHHEGRRWAMTSESGWDHNGALKKLIDWGSGATQVRVIIVLRVHEF